jgi:hypothetical protein
MSGPISARIICGALIPMPGTSSSRSIVASAAGSWGVWLPSPCWLSSVTGGWALGIAAIIWSMPLPGLLAQGVAEAGYPLARTGASGSPLIDYVPADATRRTC